MRKIRFVSIFSFIRATGPESNHTVSILFFIPPFTDLDLKYLNNVASKRIYCKHQGQFMFEEKNNSVFVLRDSLSPTGTSWNN